MENTRVSKDTRLFFIVYSNTTNEELFETLEEAEYYAKWITNSHIYIGQVRNAYKDGEYWNYEDRSDTFEMIKKVS